ncbi:ARF-binding protein [Microbotryomycetes sp. JL201]|nr:ARF-binding protein [Microbotryomycetes sp. JL201]
MSSHHRSAWSTGYGSTKETLIAFIDRACDPSMFEPNLALDLEIAELINQKKANTPREAAVQVVRHINSGNTHEAMLALALLDILVKNCGYPFHLQISTKDFLNELVRRFPERPPKFLPPTMSKILEMIHEWNNTLCVTSKHKKDLVHIRDMHRLLGYKGYRFPAFDKRAASVLNPAENLQTPEELEEEDRAAQAAKLQELIRRGTPKDLAAAQELMKIMSGAEPEKKPDYEKQVDKELDRIQQRILLLNEMLDNSKPNEKFVDGDAYDPKIQKWISESSENELGQVDRLLLMNDLINNVVRRYESFKAGDRTATAEIDPAFVRLHTGKPTKTRKNEPVSLIDFDDEPTATTPNATSSNPMDDLASLGGLSLDSPAATAPAVAKPQRVDPMALFNTAPATNGAQTSQPGASAFGAGSGSFFSNLTYNSSSSTSTPLSPANNSFGAIQLGNSRPASANSMGSGMQQPQASWSSSPLPALPAQQSQKLNPNQPPPTPPKKKDAFEDLLGDF